MHKLIISSNSETPLYRQIVEQIRRAVALGNLKEGDQLPSVRVLAEQLLINPNTVAKAYHDLVQEGIVQAQPGKGLFVLSKRELYSQSEKDRRLNEALKLFLSEAYFLGYRMKDIQQRIDREWLKFNGESNE